MKLSSSATLFLSATEMFFALDCVQPTPSRSHD